MDVKVNKEHIENVCEDIEKKKKIINNKIWIEIQNLKCY